MNGLKPLLTGKTGNPYLQTVCTTKRLAKDTLPTSLGKTLTQLLDHLLLM
jgi:hypothetical protein